MDLPLKLNGNATLVTGVDELKQSLYLILKNPIKTWYQSCSVGSRVALHSSDVMALKLDVQDTLKQLSGVTVVSVVVEDLYITIRLNYNGRELEESFKIND